jgi:hypothetical protein
MHVAEIVEVNESPPIQDGNINRFSVLTHQPTVFVGD